MAINMFMFLVLLPIIFFSKSVVSISNFSLAKPNCKDHCGKIPIPYPFGLTEECSLNKYFLVTCNKISRYHRPKAYLMNSRTQISNISLNGQIRVLQEIAHDCYAPNGTFVSGNNPGITLPDHYTVNNTANKFTVIGCDTYGHVHTRRGHVHGSRGHNYMTGCAATCDTKDDLVEGSCTGIGCCQTLIPKGISFVEVKLRSFDNYAFVNDFSNCGYGFVVEESVFSFSPQKFANLRDGKKLPLVVDWGIKNESCLEARKSMSSYACKSSNSECSDPSSGPGYRCFCKKGFEGNPYLPQGCQDIDECKDPDLNDCEYHCENEEGSYKCSCPKGYHGDKDGHGCPRDEPREHDPELELKLKLVAGFALGIIALIFVASWTYFELRRRKLIKMKQTFFLQNGGLLLQEKLKKRDRSLLEMVKIFTSSELKRATNNFHESMIIGKGGYGTVYKGVLQDNKILAIKKSKEIDPSQIEQFINEFIILSQVRHRNIVRLLGCCLEAQVPLLVYEFIGNGTLYENIHTKDKSRFLSWEKRLKIAAETAGVLSYLHSAASTPIIHRDIKSANILLDALFTAKVSDFGTSRLVPMDRAQLSTMVQGTLGYLDPEYMQTSQLTEKSDVYSFGVVLVELLTGRKALSYDKPEEEINLTNFFLYTLRKDRLFEIIEGNIVCDETREQIIEVSKLAKKCLNVRGEDRPTMKEVAIELDALRLGGRNSWAKDEDDREEIESRFGEGLDSVSFSDDCSDSITVPG
ncbi:Serine/threonine protein kinase [Handroanthus impetiginosus]|uniref:Serine/threonine protein kinase n=1 Tax=Handroanthus impetiginosus TaxID=429701 RepID=A0A2G9HNE9_9LAMI|nr:Serine/threonine protein kinase [Handroanthus impetiginosus]